MLVPSPSVSLPSSVLVASPKPEAECDAEKNSWCLNVVLGSQEAAPPVPVSVDIPAAGRAATAENAHAGEHPGVQKGDFLKHFEASAKALADADAGAGVQNPFEAATALLEADHGHEHDMCMLEKKFFLLRSENMNKCANLYMFHQLNCT